MTMTFIRLLFGVAQRFKIITCELETERERERDKDVKIIGFLCGHRTWEINSPTLGDPKKIKSNWWLILDGEEYMSAYVL